MIKFKTLILFALGAAFILYGAEKIIKNHLRNSHLIDFAEVLSSGIKKHKGVGRKPTTYEPVVKYRYRVDGKTYTGSVVFSIQRRGKIEWAQDIAKQYEKGIDIDAFYNPENPSDAYLVKYYPFFPYWVTLISILFFLLGAAVQILPDEPAAPQPIDTGKFEILPEVTNSADFVFYSILILSCLMVGAPVLGHYFFYVRPPYGAAVYIAVPIYCLLTLFFAWRFAGYATLKKKLHEARLFTDSNSFVIREKIKARVKLPIKKSLFIKKAACGIRGEISGERKNGMLPFPIDPVYFEDLISVLENRGFGAGEVIDLSCNVEIPAGKQPSSPPFSLEHLNEPSYRWYLVLKVHITGCPKLHKRFPVFVISPAD